MAGPGTVVRPNFVNTAADFTTSQMCCSSTQMCQLVSAGPVWNRFIAVGCIFQQAISLLFVSLFICIKYCTYANLWFLLLRFLQYMCARILLNFCMEDTDISMDQCKHVNRIRNMKCALYNGYMWALLQSRMSDALRFLMCIFATWTSHYKGQILKCPARVHRKLKVQKLCILSALQWIVSARIVWETVPCQLLFIAGQLEEVGMLFKHGVCPSKLHSTIMYGSNAMWWTSDMMHLCFLHYHYPITSGTGRCC